MSTSFRKRASEIALVMLLALTLYLKAAYGKPAGGQESPLAFAQGLIQAFYPELFVRNLFLDLHITRGVAGEWERFNELRFVVTPLNPLSDAILNPPWDRKTGKRLAPAQNPIVLDGEFLFSNSGRIEQMSAVVGDEVHSKENDTLHELVESHPEWSEDQEIRALKDAGAKYGPADKEELVKALRLDRAESVLGHLNVVQVQFNAPNPDHTGNFAAGTLTWSVHAEAQLPDGTRAKYALGFEPFDGRLIIIRHQH